jgi:arylsulfatase
VRLKVNGEEVARGQVPISAPLLFTANDCLDIGTDLGSPVSLDYYDRAPFPFNGKIAQVVVRYLGSTAEVKEEKQQTDAPVSSED